MKKPVKILFGISLALVIIIVAFIIYINVEPPRSELPIAPSDLATLQPQVVRLDNLNAVAQPDATSCGITTISMLASYISRQDVRPTSLIEKYELPGGMKTDRFNEILSAELPGYAIAYRCNISDLELVREIHAGLSQQLPVAAFFGAENPYNKPNYDFHASVLTGLDLAQKTVTIANAYGFNETISLDAFLDRMSYRNVAKYPIVQRAVLKLGLMDRNAIFVISKAR